MNELIGKTISGYQVVEQIGKGGMATVYRAYQPSLDRDVAIKVLPPYYANQDETFISRFKREARAIAKLRHPNILMVMDYGQEEDLSYIIMEYVDAGTLKDQMHSSFNLKVISHLVNQIASALDYAHQQGVVHRDIKPSNILMPKPDWLLLTDFGLAKMVGGSFLTQSGLTVGTPAYMSPEQGSGNKVDHRSDLYSLGVLLYELVVGEVPYQAETPMAVVVKHIVDPLPIPRDKNPNIPERIQQLILKSLAKNPEDRYQSAGEIAKELEAIASQNPDWSAASNQRKNDVREPMDGSPSTRIVSKRQESIQADTAEIVENIHTAVVEKDTSMGGDQKPSRKNRNFLFAGLGIVVVCGVVATLAALALKPQFQSLWDNPIPENITEEDQSDLPELEDLSGEEGSLYEDGLDLLARNEIEKAAEVFREALRENPRLWGQFYGLVIQRFDQGDHQGAFTVLMAGIEGHSDPPPDDLDFFGWMLMGVGRFWDAYDLFVALIEINPSYADGYEGLNSAAFNLENEDETIDFLMDLSKKFRGEPLIYAAVADLYYLIGDYQHSIEMYDQVMDLHPEDPWIYMGSVGAYMLAGEEDQAVDMIAKALEMDPNSSVIADVAGIHYRDMGMDQAALDSFMRAIELDPDSGWAQVGLAQMLIYLDQDLERVTDLLRNAEKNGREDEDYWLLEEVAWAWADFGDCRRAVPIFLLIQNLPDGYLDVSEGLDYCKDQSPVE